MTDWWMDVWYFIKAVPANLLSKSPMNTSHDFYKAGIIYQ